MEKKFEIHKFVPQELSVKDFNAEQFPLVVTDEAQEFASKGIEESQTSKFIISDIVAKQSGIDDLNKQKFNALVEERLDERVSEIKEKVSAEAKEIGYKEGYAQAYAEANEKISAKIDSFSEMISELENQKQKIFSQNKEQVIKLIELMAGKVIYKNVDEDVELIERVITNLVTDLDKDEKVILHLGSEDYRFLKSIDEKLNNKLENREIELHESEELSQGGCVIETEYGSIDVTLEERINQIWSALTSNKVVS